MTLKEKKRKLSEILGINLFEARYREIDAVLGDEDTEAEKAAVAEESEVEATAAESTGEIGSDEPENENKSNETTEAEEAAKGDDETEDTADEEQAGDPESDGDVGSDADGEESTEDTPEKIGANGSQDDDSPNLEAELFDAKLEAKLLRSGVREDRLDAAKKLFKADHAIEDISKLEAWIKDYPEWIKKAETARAKGFGMDVGEHDDGETAEERRLRELGLD